eukprot:GILI01002140.1.p1 GENE.GILI01002140.1~~GILI01002140.1.p1  ORF type:complete len:451 (+),score=142.94 GILI01002140.1:109-1461(+)
MGKKIGKYELGKTLGSGNFSKVKIGTDCETGETWAIKIIDKEQLQKERMEEQLKREIAVMKMLKHENVVQLKEVMQTANHIYLVLELVTGGELFDKIVQAKRFEEPVARRYFHQLIMGINYCHQQGIAHRDLKPENLLLDGSDTLKIMDFGLSNLQRADGQGTLLQTVCGTPNYVAPEVLKERGYNGLIADIWSCGVVLFVMLAGYLPFDDQNMNALFHKIERGEYRMARHFSDSAKDLIAKMLTVDPTKRLNLQAIINHPWFQVDFDASKYTKTPSTKLEVSEDQVRNAISDADVHKTATTAAAPTSSVPASVASKLTSAGGSDAFDLISRLTSGSLNPLITFQQGMVRTSTRFLVHGTAKDVVDALEGLKANPKSKENTNEIKGFVNGNKGLLTYMVTVVPTCASSLTLVELRRGRGDILEFHELFREIVKKLGPKVRSKEMPGATTA